MRKPLLVHKLLMELVVTKLPSSLTSLSLPYFLHRERDTWSNSNGSKNSNLTNVLEFRFCLLNVKEEDHSVEIICIASIVSPVKWT